MSTGTSESFRSTLVNLWFRLMCLGIVALVFAEALVLAPGKAQGWAFYLSTWEVLFEVTVRLIFAALVGAFSGTILTAILAPILWVFKSSRGRVVEWTTTIACLW